MGSPTQGGRMQLDLLPPTGATTQSTGSQRCSSTGSAGVPASASPRRSPTTRRRVGVIEDYALTPDGDLAPTTIMSKRL